MRIIDNYYRYFGETDVVKIAKVKKLHIEWIVEAGCHDAEDTLNLARVFTQAKIYGFEPDPIARAAATEKISKNVNLNVTISPYALSNTNASGFLRFSHEIGGSGSSEISSSGQIKIELRKLDDIFTPDSGVTGLLWLDVEGHAINALEGMKDSLKCVSIAKIEIQMHDMSPSRPSDYLQVLRLLSTARLYPAKAPLHPGYFGDILFINSKFMSARERFTSLALTLQMILLHRYVYPLLKKPKK